MKYPRGNYVLKEEQLIHSNRYTVINELLTIANANTATINCGSGRQA